MKTQHFSMPRIMVWGLVWISIMVFSLGNIQTVCAEPQNSGPMIEPSAVMQNIEMNVMYRGYANKYAISVPGISNDKVTVEAEGATVKKGSGIWIFVPTEDARKVKVTIYADIKGQKKAMSTMLFAVKTLPKLEAWLTVNEHVYRSGDNVPFSALMNESAKLEAGYGPTEAFNLPFEIVSFQVNILGKIIIVNGNMFTDAMRERIQLMKKGHHIILLALKARTPEGATISLSPFTLILE